jgi:hypothetical protein
MRTHFASDRPQRVEATLPKPILARLAALEEAERRRSGDAADQDVSREPSSEGSAEAPR